MARERPGLAESTNMDHAPADYISVPLRELLIALRRPRHAVSMLSRSRKHARVFADLYIDPVTRDAREHLFRTRIGVYARLLRFVIRKLPDAQRPVSF